MGLFKGHELVILKCKSQVLQPALGKWRPQVVELAIARLHMPKVNLPKVFAVLGATLLIEWCPFICEYDGELQYQKNPATVGRKTFFQPPRILDVYRP